MFVDNYLPAPSGEATIAVLPFTNLSADGGNDAFIDSFVVELHNSLTQIDDLRVTALTSSMTYRDTNLNVPAIAAELGVDYLLEGGVARGAEDVRVFASLIRGDNGSSVWSNPYDRELDDPQALQLELAEAVAERLSVSFGVGDFERQAGGTTNLDAYDHFLEARGWLQQDALQDALSSYELALSLDPEFGLAQIGLASLRYVILRSNGYTFSTDTSNLNLELADRQSVQSDIDAARAALALAREMLPDHPFMQLNDALILVDELRWAEAEAAFRERLAAAGPSDYAGNYSLGSFLVSAGRARQGLPFLERARQLDPLEARPVVGLSIAYDALGDYERAVELDREAQSLNGYGAASIAVPFWRAVGHDGTEAFDGVVTGGLTAEDLLEQYDQRDEILARNSLPVTIANLALTAAALGDNETAMRAWARTLPRAPGVPAVYLDAADAECAPARGLPAADERNRPVGLLAPEWLAGAMPADRA